MSAWLTVTKIVDKPNALPTAFPYSCRRSRGRRPGNEPAQGLAHRPLEEMVGKHCHRDAGGKCDQHVCEGLVPDELADDAEPMPCVR
jgi:hypothetical protein